MEQRIYVGDKDARSWIQWRPIPKASAVSLDTLAPGLAPFHATVEAWFGRWYFLALEGRLGERMLSLPPNRPGYDPEDFLDEARRYASARSDAPHFIPFGLDNSSSLQIVVDARARESDGCGLRRRLGKRNARTARNIARRPARPARDLRICA